MKRYAINRDWMFYESDDGHSFSFSKPPKKAVDLPHDFIISKERSKSAPGGAANGFFGQGQGVYEKELSIMPEWRDQWVMLDVDGAYMNAEVVLNGEVLALHPYGYTPFLVDLTPAIKRDGPNRLKIVTQSRQPSTRWYSGGGLYRDVSLWVGGPVRVAPWDLFVTTPVAEPDRALVRAQVDVTNSGEARAVEMHVRALDAIGNIVAQAQADVALSANGKTNTCLELNLKNPALWDIGAPNLYRLQLEIRAEGVCLDETEVSFGIRKIEADSENGFRLNGRPLKMKGGCIHHDNGILGACAYPAAERRKIEILKDAGYNAVRISHYPPSSAMLEICDELGVLLLDEAFDAWRESKCPLDYHLYFEDWWERDIESMVLRDRNHPCVITYSTGNEIGERDGGSNGAYWSRKLADKVRTLDNTRFVLSALCNIFPDDMEATNFDANLTSALAGNSDPWGDRTREYVEPLDIVGYNYLYKRYALDAKKFPGRVICGTETHAFDTYDYWQATLENAHVIGDFIWTAIDYLGEVGVGKVYWEKDQEAFRFLAPYPWRANFQSDHDLCGFIQPQGFYRRIMWGVEQGPALFTTHPKRHGDSFKGTGWHWRDVQQRWGFSEEWIGKPVKVEAYADADEVEFIVNGRSLGRAKVHKLIAEMDIPYEPGTLEAVALSGGKERGRSSLETTGAPTSVRLTADRDHIKPDAQDLCFVAIELKDAKDMRVPDAECALSVEITGPGALAGLGSGDPKSEDLMGTDRCHAYQGRALCAVKALAAGKIELKVIAEGVGEARCTIVAE